MTTVATSDYNGLGGPKTLDRSGLRNVWLARSAFLPFCLPLTISAFVASPGRAVTTLGRHVNNSAARHCVISLCLNWGWVRVSMAVTPMPRKRERDGLYRSSQVAKILGVSSRTLYRMLADGRIQEPMRNPENRYRLWTEVDIHGIREVMKK